jgi:phosphoglycerate dehydrogenase-like enzyme
VTSCRKRVASSQQPTACPEEVPVGDPGLPYTLGRVNVWIPDRAGREAIGELPEDVTLNFVPADGGLPSTILDAEFLVPTVDDHRTTDLLARMSALRVVQTLSAGVDWLLPLIPEGVTVCDASGAHDVAVAEWVLAMILASQKMLPELRDCQREHQWAWRRSDELAGSTVMILGYGSIGSAVEARLEPFEVDLIRVARHARTGVHSVDDLGSLLPLAQIVVVLLPLTPATTGLLDGTMLARLPCGALLVNAARGSVLDTAALLELLNERGVRAALDVTDPEPLPADHPLWEAPGVLITPHYAGDTPAADRRAFALVGEQLRRYVRKDPLLNVVEHGY